MTYHDFNTAESTSYELIPEGTIAKVFMKIKLGGYNDKSKGWTGDFATRNDTTGSIYLSCEYTIVEGQYKGRKIWSLIGLYSDKNNNIWGDMGRSFIRSILNSTHGFTDKDTSDAAIAARKINGFADLEGLEFIARIYVQPDENGNDKNVIRTAITPAHKDYQAAMSGEINLGQVGTGGDYAGF